MNLCERFERLEDFKNYCQHHNIDPIEELLKGAPSRSATFRKALDYLDRTKPSILVETGTARGRFDVNLPSIFGDGGGTLVFALWCSKNNAKIYTVDIDQTCIDNCKLNIEALGLMDYVEFIVNDSVAFLQTCDLTDLKFLFLDSYDFDYNNPIPSQTHHKKEYEAVKDKLHKQCCILIDDCDLPHGGKGRYVEEELVKDNFTLIQAEYQHLYERI
jgi:hypothetical protein